jgi:F-type H+-transporting ATPase subunit b
MKIDWWTLGLQAVNVVILIWLLTRFFWRPVAAMIQQRRAAVQKTLADAEAQRVAASAALQEIERTRAGFAQERDAILAAAHQAAEQAHTVRLKESDTEIAALRAAAKAQIETERTEAAGAWSKLAASLAVEIAQRLAGRLDGPAVREAFLSWLVGEIRTLPEATRKALAEEGALLQAVSAAPLDPADEEHYRTVIRDAIGGRPRIEFQTDPGLIAGLELQGDHVVVSNSWRADLAAILLDLHP